MNFANGLQRAYETQWSFINTFKVQFHFGDLLITKGIWTRADEDNLNLNIKSINTPQYTNSPIEAYVGDQWKIHNGRNEMWRFTISFRDQDQLKLYRKFIKTYELQRTAYFDQCKTEITLWKDGDYLGQQDHKIFKFNDCMIESVSQIQFSNETETQIVEFDVEFKCATPNIDPGV